VDSAREVGSRVQNAIGRDVGAKKLDKRGDIGVAQIKTDLLGSGAQLPDCGCHDAAPPRNWIMPAAMVMIGTGSLLREIIGANARG
jgi:hypothetical protein